MLLRDLNQLKAQNNPSDASQAVAQPQPVESQSKSPMAIEIGSSPQVVPKDEPIDNGSLGNKPGGAPIPDMGMGIGLDLGVADSTQPNVSIKDENVSSQAPGDGDVVGSMKQESKESNGEAPMAGMDLTLDGNQSGIGGTDDAVLDLTNSDLNFTDMEFTLAPANDSQTQSGGDGNAATNNNESTFDLSSFNTTDGASGNLGSLDNMLPTTLTEQQGSATNAPAGQATDSQTNAEGEKKEQSADASLTDVFTGDGQTDGMDFDFSLGDGMGGDTFDDLMNDRDNTFDTMEHGDFDANFFGLDKIDES